MEEKEMNGKEYDEISLQRDLANANRELDLNRGQVEDMQKKRGFLLREIDIVTRQTELALKKWKLLKPNWEFEKDPEYVELGKEFAQLNFEKKMFEYSNQLAQVDRLINSINEQYKSVEIHRDGILEKLSEGEQDE